MKKNILILFPLFVLMLGGFTQMTSGQGGSPRTSSKILYHNGPIMAGASNVYFIWYGCWNDTCGIPGGSNTTNLLANFVSNLGGSPYFQLNAMYANGGGQAPSGALFDSGITYDGSYSHGFDLTEDDLQDIVRDRIENLGRDVAVCS